MALEQIEEGQEINFTDDPKVQLINNLLVSIITDKGTQPVINTGSLQRKIENNFERGTNKFLFHA